MRSIEFSKWDPSGNTTLFFPQDTPGNHAALAHEALRLQKLGGEQAGFIDTQNGSLIMAGGEFCVNATRCFGALLDLSAQRQGIRISRPLPVPISCVFPDGRTLSLCALRVACHRGRLKPHSAYVHFPSFRKKPERIWWSSPVSRTFSSTRRCTPPLDLPRKKE